MSRFRPETTTSLLGTIVILAAALAPVLSGVCAADTTLQILNTDFPDDCGAPSTSNAQGCRACHALEGNRARSRGPSPFAPGADGYRAVVSRDEESRIRVLTPAAPVPEGTPFWQIVQILDEAAMFRYGYSRGGEPFVLLDERWVFEGSRRNFPEDHSPGSLGLLEEPGDYIFRVDLVYRKPSPSARAPAWDRLILLWTVRVERADSPEGAGRVSHPDEGTDTPASAALGEG